VPRDAPARQSWSLTPHDDARWALRDETFVLPDVEPAG
jgi:hypothetical protein